MIKIVKGDILNQKTQALVNTVNCVGVMGRGIALGFRDAYPENYHLYKEACDRGEVKPGSMFIYVAGDLFDKKIIINFPTKRHWKDRSKIGDIGAGLEALVKVVRQLDIKSIAIPPLGCGLGGLDWNDVKPMIENAMNKIPDVEAIIIEPDPSFNARRTATPVTVNGKLTVGRAGMIALMGRYLEALMDTGVTLLELHKLMYFFQERGEPLKLNFQKALYGPYAVNLRHVLDVMNNVYIQGFDDRQDNPDKVIDIIGNSYGKAMEYLENNPETKDRIENVAELIAGFETPFGLELLSTVHWVVKKEGANSPEMAIAKTHGWNDRKKMFDENQIGIAWNRLHEQKWI